MIAIWFRWWRWIWFLFTVVSVKGPLDFTIAILAYFGLYIVEVRFDDRT